MRERAITCSEDVVDSIVALRKSETRRIMAGPWNDEPDKWEFGGMVYDRKHERSWARMVQKDGPLSIQIACPYGFPGTILYVRETHFKYGHWIEDEGEFTSRGKQKWKFIPLLDATMFRPDVPKKYFKSKSDSDNSNNSGNSEGWFKRLARFMPRKDARIKLEVVDITCERLQSITDAGAIAEGIESYDFLGRVRYRCYQGRKDFFKGSSYSFNHGKETQSGEVASFCTLWMVVNSRESWILNPWVFVVKFKVTKCPPHERPVGELPTT